MFRHLAADLILLPLAVIVVLSRDVVWPLLRGAGRRITGWRPLLPLRRYLGRLPVLAALTLFLVPELCSRCGTLASAWLLLQGDWWRALLVYAASKLIAGGTAWWIYTACEPALLQVRVFAAVHGGIASYRAATLARLRSSAPRASRFATLLQRVRAWSAVRVLAASADPGTRLP